MNSDGHQRPYFLWDYDLTNADVRRILAGSNETEKIWMMSRIVESANYEDIWKYISYTQFLSYFPKLQLKPQIRRVWEHALSVWEGRVYGQK